MSSSLLNSNTNRFVLNVPSISIHSLWFILPSLSSLIIGMCVRLFRLLWTPYNTYQVTFLLLLLFVLLLILHCHHVNIGQNGNRKVWHRRKVWRRRKVWHRRKVWRRKRCGIEERCGVEERPDLPEYLVITQSVLWLLPEILFLDIRAWFVIRVTYVSFIYFRMFRNSCAFLKKMHKSENLSHSTQKNTIFHRFRRNYLFCPDFIFNFLHFKMRQRISTGH